MVFGNGIMKMYAWVLMGLLFMGVLYSSESLAAALDYRDEIEQSLKEYSVGLQHLTLKDSISTIEECCGVTEIPVYQPLAVQPSDAPGFEYMAVTPYYKVFFKGTSVKMVVQDAWIAFSLVEQGLGEINSPALMAEQNLLSVLNVFDSVDLSYTVDTSLLTEVMTLKKCKEIDRIIQKVSWEGMTPEYEDGSILFLHEEKELLKILPPFMKDAEGVICKDIHYELVETETGHELHKVIDEKGLHWLKQAVYPVTIDPSIKTFEDAWESSGLTPFGQYFKNVKEYVNPATGHLTVTQTDLTIPGRGLDVEISRVCQMPAVFYGLNPYEYEAPPVDVGNGWQLDFPYIGTKYLHLWGGTVYNIEWMNNQFENHTGSHFILVKNGDSTYTLTTASGTVYEFSTAGKLTEIKDLDQNSITFTYTSGDLTSITDTIGRTINLVYSNNQLWKIVYNNAEIEFSYDGNGCLQWTEDFLDRRTSYEYNTGYNTWLLSKIEYPTEGYTTYAYNRYTNTDYFKYYVTDQRVYETEQVRHNNYSYTGSFSEITASVMTIKNESDVVQGFNHFTINDGLVTERTVKNASSAAIQKVRYTYNANKEVTEKSVYADGSNLSYTTYYAYDNWGNKIYTKNAEGHEQFFSYANTDTSGFFTDNTGTVVKTFTNAFSDNVVPSSVHTALLGTAEKQDAVYVRELYFTYDVNAHPTQSTSSFGNYTNWLTYSGTFNEKTGNTSFFIDLTGHTVTGNGVLQITGLPSDDTYTEMHSLTPDYYGGGCNPSTRSTWTCYGWINSYFKVDWAFCCGKPPDVDCDSGLSSIGPFTHRPGTLGYQSYTTLPSCGQQATSFTVKTFWKAYPGKVQYNLDNTWKTVSSNVSNGTATKTVPGLTNGENTLYFSENSSYKTKFSWELYVPVDNAPDVYTTTVVYDAYGNATSITDAELNTTTFTYSPDYSYAYLTEISTTVGQDTITARATYDYYRGWITSIQQPKGVAGSGYDTLYTYDVLGRITKKEFPLLSGQSERSYVEAVYDDINRTVTVIDQLRHYIVREYDKLGRLTNTSWYTGQYGSGTLYATESYTYRYDNKISTVTDPGNHLYTYTYDFLGRCTQILFPDSSTVSYSYDDYNNKTTFTNGRGYDKMYWYDWLNRLEKVEQEYAVGLCAVTVYQYDKINHLTSVTDAENRTTTYEYASLFGATKIVYPDSTNEEYAYDNMGNITLLIDGNGNETVYTYDSLYRLTQIQYQDQSTVSFTYDLNSNRTKMDDNAVNTGDYVEYGYDTWDRLTTKTRHINQDVYTVSYQYDTANRLTHLTYPNNMEILYSYDDLNRTIQIKQYIDGVTDEIIMDNVQYTTDNLLTQFDYGNGLKTTFSHDQRDRTLTIDVKNGETSFLSLDYTYDNTSNITQLLNGWRDTNSGWHSDIESYTYDGLDRLTSASCTVWSHSYSYDKAGNRTAKDSITYTINSVNEVTGLSDGTLFTYDDNGNRIQKTKGLDTWVYTYDYANRLTTVEKNSEIVGEYIYDGDGKRLQSIENNESITSLYIGFDLLYEETTTGTACYIYGPTGRIAKITTATNESHTFFYHTDNAGSTRLVTDEDKTIVSTATYHPFGKINTKEGPEEHLFTGKQKDSTGLYYYGARYYDCDLGTFITRDPVRGWTGSPQTLNPYSYCLNNPTKYVDPDGRDPINCDKYKRNEEEYLQHSHAPQKIAFVKPEGGHELFFYMMVALYVLGAALVIGMAVATFAPAFFAWLTSAPGLTILKQLAMSLLFFIAGLIVDHILDEHKMKEMQEKMAPEECNKFFTVLQEYLDAIGDEDLRVTGIDYNEDGTEVTITFNDKSTQTWRFVDGRWVPVPTETDSTSESGNSSSGNSLSNSSSSGGIPPVGPVARGNSIL